MTREEFLIFYIRLLEMEVEALRSVLSEWDADKNCYIMMNKADAIERLKTHTVRP